MDIPFTPGSPLRQAGPLARFLPPLEEGLVTRQLASFGQPGDLLLDPFGTSPRLLAEAARAERAVVVAANNPLMRFILLHSLRPFRLAELQAALARLAAVPKDGGRLEPFLLDLYQTECSQCGRPVIADHFVWEREPERLVSRAYVCEHCNHAVEEPVTNEDRARADAYAGRGLHYALALERVAPATDPDRKHAEAALAVYPGRAQYALISILTKMEQLRLESNLEAALHALLISAFDAANALWGHPEGRRRPRRLAASPSYRETNVWRALERAVEIWTLTGPEVDAHVAGTDGGDGPPEPGSVLILPGPAREFLDLLVAWEPRGLITVLPRPNQAFWTLSALWSAWLWGREAAAPARVALRRRRYDWSWHAVALQRTLAPVVAALPPKSPALTVIAEFEPDFLEAALTGMDAAGMGLTGRTLRRDTREAVLRWEGSSASEVLTGEEEFPRIMAEEAEGALRQRGEPGSYAVVHAAAWTELARRRLLAKRLEQEGSQLLTNLGREFELALEPQGPLLRLDEHIEIESGLFWLKDALEIAPALSDRVETRILSLLREMDTLSGLEVEAQIGRIFPGLQTPNRRLVRACLASYAEEDPEAPDEWRLRPEDQAAGRAADLREMLGLLADLGDKLGFEVEHGDTLNWHQAGKLAHAFRVQDSAALGEIHAADLKSPLIHVLPGGRGSLVAFKAAQDPRLAAWLAEGVRVVKFRHVRRLSEDTTLTRENLEERLSIDPPGHQDPQLPLL